MSRYRKVYSIRTMDKVRESFEATVKALYRKLQSDVRENGTRVREVPSRSLDEARLQDVEPHAVSQWIREAFRAYVEDASQTV